MATLIIHDSAYIRVLNFGSEDMYNNMYKEVPFKLAWLFILMSICFAFISAILIILATVSQYKMNIVNTYRL